MLFVTQFGEGTKKRFIGSPSLIPPPISCSHFVFSNMPDKKAFRLNKISRWFQKLLGELVKSENVILNLIKKNE